MDELATSIYVDEIDVPRVNSWAQVLEAMTLCEIWGVGRRLAIQLLADDLRTALQVGRWRLRRCAGAGSSRSSALSY